jgi:ferredoxin
MSKIVYVNKDECTSCEECVESLPDFFRMDDDDFAESHNGGSHINEAEVPDDKVDEVQEQIDACPGECILWK